MRIWGLLLICVLIQTQAFGSGGAVKNVSQIGHVVFDDSFLNVFEESFKRFKSTIHIPRNAESYFSIVRGKKESVDMSDREYILSYCNSPISLYKKEGSFSVYSQVGKPTCAAILEFILKVEKKKGRQFGYPRSDFSFQQIRNVTGEPGVVGRGTLSQEWGFDEKSARKYVWHIVIYEDSTIDFALQDILATSESLASKKT